MPLRRCLQAQAWSLRQHAIHELYESGGVDDVDLNPMLASHASRLPEGAVRTDDKSRRCLQRPGSRTHGARRQRGVSDGPAAVAPGTAGIFSQTELFNETGGGFR